MSLSIHNNSEVHFQHVDYTGNVMGLSVTGSLFTADDLRLINNDGFGLEISQSLRNNLIENSVIDSTATGIRVVNSVIAVRNTKIDNFTEYGVFSGGGIGSPRPIITGDTSISGSGHSAINATSLNLFPFFYFHKGNIPMVENEKKEHNPGYIFHSQGSTNQSILVGFVYVNKDDLSLFLPSFESYRFYTFEQQTELFLNAVFHMNNMDFASAKNEFINIIYNFPGTDIAMSSLGYLPFVAIESNEEISYMLDFLNTINHPVEFMFARKTTMANIKMSSSMYPEAIELLEEIIIHHPNAVERLMAELTQAYCFLRLVETGTRNVSNVARRQPNTLEEYLELQQYIMDRIKNLTDDKPDELEIVPEEIMFSVNNFPNPFNPETTINFSFSSGEGRGEGSYRVEIIIYNVRGQRIRTLLDENRSPGHHSVIWNGRDDNGRTVSSGVYLYRITAGDNVATRRMLLMK